MKKKEKVGSLRERIDKALLDVMADKHLYMLQNTPDNRNMKLGLFISKYLESRADLSSCGALGFNEHAHEAWFAVQWKMIQAFRDWHDGIPDSWVEAAKWDMIPVNTEKDYKEYAKYMREGLELFEYYYGYL